MNIIDVLKKRACCDKKTIILPESMDTRVLEATKIIVDEEIANIILIGNEENIRQHFSGNIVDKITILDPNTSSVTEEAINLLVELRKEKGMTINEATKLLHEDYMYFACMLVKMGMADGVVSGACHSTANTLRPALQIIKTKPDAKLVSSFFLMNVPSCEFGEDGVFVFADCGLEQNPDSESLAAIAASSAESFYSLVKKEPKVALLSHSTMGSAMHDDVSKVIDAVKIAKEKYPNYLIDGELQLDAAIVPEIAKSKAPNSVVAGKANVLVFPDLDAGNIGYKLVQRLAKAEAYGPITQGIAAPINDLSRGCSIDDIVGAVVITAVQAQNK